MDEASTPGARTRDEVASRDTAEMSRLRAALHPDVIGAVVVVVSAVLVTSLGLADVPVGWIIAGTVGLTVVAILAGHAARKDVESGTRVRLLTGATVTLVLIVVGIAGYVRWWDPRNEGVRLWEFLLADVTETQCIRVSGEPGGEPLVLAPSTNSELAPICGGATHFFECRSEDDDGVPWLRLAGSRYWLPEDVLRPRVGSSTGRLPAC